jgi:chromosome segregation ATPase
MNKHISDYVNDCNQKEGKYKKRCIERAWARIERQISKLKGHTNISMKQQDEIQDDIEKKNDEIRELMNDLAAVAVLFTSLGLLLMPPKASDKDKANMSRLEEVCANLKNEIKAIEETLKERLDKSIENLG